MLAAVLAFFMRKVWWVADVAFDPSVLSVLFSTFSLILLSTHPPKTANGLDNGQIGRSGRGHMLGRVGWFVQQGAMNLRLYAGLGDCFGGEITLWKLISF